MLYIRTPALIYLITGLFDKHLLFPLTSEALVTTILISVSVSLAFLDSTYK